MTSSYETFSVPAPQGVDSANALEKLIEQLAAVEELNQILASATSAGRPSAGLIERLKQWLEDLVDHMKVIVKSLPEVDSFSISVGVPLGVNVTVTFAADR
jgi:hypothetical protein